MPIAMNEEWKATPVLNLDTEIFECLEKRCHWTLARPRVAVKIGVSMSKSGNGWQKPHHGSGKTNIDNRWGFTSCAHKMRGNLQIKVPGSVGTHFIYLDAQGSERIDHQGSVPGIKYAT
jgi:hypothetical protein